MNKLYPRLKKKKTTTNLYRMNGEKDFGTHKTILIAIIYNMKLMSIYGRPSISCEATIFQSYFSE